MKRHGRALLEAVPAGASAAHTERRDLVWVGLVLFLAAGGVVLAQWLGLPGAFALLVVAPAALSVFFRWPESALYLIFLLVSFGSEYSQTEWGVRSADQLATIYNVRIFPGVIASPFDLLFAALMVLWLLRKWLRREPLVWLPERLLLPAILCLGFVLYATILGLFRLPLGTELYHILRELRPFLYALGLLVVAFDILTSRRRVQPFWQLVILVAAVRGVQGIIRHVLGIGRAYYGTTMVYYDYSDTILVLAGISFLLVWLLGWQRWRLPSLAALGLGATPMVYTFLFSFRRSFWIGAAVSIGLLFFALNRRERRRYLVLATLGMVLMLGLLLASGQTALVGQRVVSVTDAQDDPSNYFRVLDTENALNAIYESGALGMGFGSRYRVVASVYWLADFISHVSRASHNGYLYLLMKMGLLGLLSWTLLWLGVLSVCVELLRRSQGRFRPIGLGVSAVLIACAIANLFLPLYYNLRPLLLLALFSALAIAAWKLEREGESLA